MGRRRKQPEIIPQETLGDDPGVDVVIDTPEPDPTPGPDETPEPDPTPGPDETPEDIPEKAKLVMTAHEMENEEKKNEEKKPVEKEKIEKQPVEKKDLVYECPFAPMGKSSTTIECQAHENGQKVIYRYPVDMLNRRVRIPVDMPEEEKRKLIMCMQENGFEDVTEGAKGKVYVKDSAKYMYYAVHPAHTEKHPMNGNMSLVLKDDNGHDVKDKDGNQITKQVVIKDGTVETDDKQIYQLLLKSGFFPGGKEIIHD